MRFVKSFLLVFVFSSSLELINASERINIEFSDQWRFSKSVDNQAGNLQYVDTGWSIINIPHTWNALDGQDGGKNYSRTISWYRKYFDWQPEYEGKRIYLEVLAASLMSDTYINGQWIGQHKGGYNAFRYDITNFLRKSGTNLVAIKVDNSFKDDIAPLSADFTFFGGIYRKVSLILADDVHVDLENSGSNGLFLTTTEVTKASAKLQVRSKIINKANVAKSVSVRAILKVPEKFNGIAMIDEPQFDTSKLVSGEVIRSIYQQNINIPANGSYDFAKEVVVSNPRLWNGLQDPFRYQVDLIVEEQNQVVDKVTDYVGFRYYKVDATGFYLNGRLYPLRGVNRHQDFKDLGPAIGRNEENIDFSLIYKMGANACRLAHYPQSPFFHDLFDKYGIVVWVEIPFVDKVGNDTAAFMATTRKQLREMILQRYNRPSILMWGLQNEVNPNYFDASMTSIMPSLNRYAKTIDSTRFTVQAQFLRWSHHWTTDIFANNIYHGWYGSGRLANTLDAYKNASYKGKFVPMGISEYGAGGNPFQHENLTLSGTTSLKAPYGHNNPWHPEEYQTKVHELAIKDINVRTWIWGTFLWAMFDFASDSRNEGGTPGINDKGIVSQDRKVLKDSYYLYKANWTNKPMMHIGSRRYTERFVKSNPVTIYTNSKSVELIVNGTSKGTKTLSADSACVLAWGNVDLTNVGSGVAGRNEIISKSIDTNVADTVVWYRRFSNIIFLKSEKFAINNQNRTISLNNEVSFTDIKNLIYESNGGSFVVLAKDGITEITEGLVRSGMKLKVTAEDKLTQIVYIFEIQHLAYMKSVNVSSVESQTNSALKLADGDMSSRWASNTNGSKDKPQWVEVDLGNEYVLNNIGIHWYNSTTNTRAYKYQILARKNSDTAYEVLVDRMNNMTTGSITETISNVVSRYIKINVTGSSNTTQWALPSIYELVVNGWAIRSQVYAIDYNTKTIVIPPLDGMLQQSDFLANIQFEGNMTYKIDAGAYHVLTGDKLIVTDNEGKTTEFSILISNATSLNKSVVNGCKISNIGRQIIVHCNDLKIKRLFVYDANGKLVFESKIKRKLKFSLPKGNYLIKASRNNEKVSQVVAKCVLD